MQTIIIIALVLSLITNIYLAFRNRMLNLVNIILFKENVSEAESERNEVDDLNLKTVSELRQIARTFNLNLKGATKKDEIIKIISEQLDF
ncbi:MAG: hypothetical protein ACTSQE_14920 [Candidatus Heimdallarchaeaceae archaeon]